MNWSSTDQLLEWYCGAALSTSEVCLVPSTAMHHRKLPCPSMTGVMDDFGLMDQMSKVNSLLFPYFPKQQFSSHLLLPLLPSKHLQISPPASKAYVLILIRWLCCLFHKIEAIRLSCPTPYTLTRGLCIICPTSFKGRGDPLSFILRQSSPGFPSHPRYLPQEFHQLHISTSQPTAHPTPAHMHPCSLVDLPGSWQSSHFMDTFPAPIFPSICPSLDPWNHRDKECTQW